MRGKRKIISVYIAAFIIPFLIMGLAFIKLKIYPFGDQQVLTMDSYYQYYPFLMELLRKVKNGESLLHSWRIGLGSDFVAVMVCVLASPLNLLTILLPEGWTREIFALMTLIKIGFAGGFCAYALNQINPNRETNKEEIENGINMYGVLIFSTFYALCAWVQWYYWNIMFLDPFAIFPLVVVGIYQLVKEKKYKLYTISLATSILVCFYIGFSICIFTMFFFFAQCIVHWMGVKEMWQKMKNIIFFSIISLMISSVCTIPAYVVLQNASRSVGFPNKLALIKGWIEIISGIFAYQEPRKANWNLGPHIYCGVFSLLFLFAFFRLRNVSKREKAAYFGMTLFLVVSTNINVLDYIWHGFRYTHGNPYRFSFMISFLVVMMAYRSYISVDMLQKKDLFFVGIAGVLCYLVVMVDWVYRFGRDNGCISLLETFDIGGNNLREFLFKNLLLMIVYWFLLALLIKKKITRKRFTLLLMYLAGLELISTVTIRNNEVWSTDRNSYPDRYAAVREALVKIEGQEENSFYRTEITNLREINPAALYDYRGVTIFSSTVNASVARMLGDMGIRYWDNGYDYKNTTPVNNLFLNLKYLITKGEDEIVNSEYLAETVKVEDVVVYQNEAYLPIGFMVENSMADFDFEGNNPLEKQNNLLKAASGIDGDVFEALDIIHVGHENVDVGRYEYGLYHYEPLKWIDETENEKFKFNYEMLKNGSVYVYMGLNSIGSNALIEFHDKTSSYSIEGGVFFPAGTYQKGDIFSVRSETEAGSGGDMRIFVGILNQDVFDKAYESLKDETLEVTEWDSTHIKGNIAVKKDNLLYTSIPCEKGWKVYVDGARADITLIADAFVGVMLTKGEHTVEFVYSPTYVYVGMMISLVGIGLFVLVVVMEKRERKSLDRERKS